jgi:hypothetical protein
MKVTPRFLLRAGLVLCAAGALGAFGACSKDNGVGPTPPPPPPPPPPPALRAPVGFTANVASQTKINLVWIDSTTGETGFQIQRCTGANCSNFAQVGTNLAANSTAYTDDGLTANTSYSYRARAVNATDSSTWTTTVSATTGVIAGGSAFTMVGAGAVMQTCLGSPGTTGTSRIVDSILTQDADAIAFVAGDALADPAAGTTFENCYANSAWGKFKDRTYFAIGDNDYAGGRGETDIFGYLGNRTGKQTDGFGSFSFDKGNWHVVFINSADWQQSNAELQSASGKMNTWLAADLGAVPASKCIAVFSWERRMYTDGAGALAKQFNLLNASSIMESAGTDLLVSSKDHIYARFPQMDHLGVASANGFRQFIVGTGGSSLHQAITPTAGNPVEAQNGGAAGSYGVLKLKLNDNSYEWEFIPTVAGGFTDKSTAPVACHQ